MTSRHALTLVAFLGLGCSGTIAGDREGGDPPGNDMGSGGGTMRDRDRTGGTAGSTVTPLQPPAAATLAEAAPARVRRLTATEIKSSIRDVFLGGGAFEARFPTEDSVRAFDNLYNSLSVSDQFADALQDASEQAAAAAVKNLPALHPCDPAAKGESACANDFVEVFGLRTFRKPLSAGQKERLVAVYTKARATSDYKTAIATVIEAMLQSPPFLFRSEYPTPVAGKKIAPLGSYEVASALSYFIWGSSPDATLLEAAKGGKLGTKGEIQAQARRMVQDPRAKETFGRFFRDWLELRRPEDMQKSDKGFSSSVARSMYAEVTGFVDQVLWSGDASLKTLLTATSSSLNADLAKLYGVTGPKGAAFEPTMLDPAIRAGFLTQPGFIASHTPAGGSNPIFMGHFVRTKLFCQTLPPPPPGIPPAPDNVMLSTREKFAQHQNDPQCSGCHQLMDPIGFGFERYDVLGRYRTMEGTVPLTGAGELTETDVNGKFTGPVELAAKLAGSKQVDECFAGQMLEFLLGRETGAVDKRLKVDKESLAALAAGAWKKSDMKELIVGVVGTDSFLYRDTSALPAGGAQ